MDWVSLSRIADVDAAAWDALVPDGNPFVRHAFLHALEASGSLRPELGWAPRHVAGLRDGRLVAAAPAYLKHNSHGEFVFDWHWADASHRSGIPYYPKLLVAVPYSPVPGPRLLFHPDHWPDARTAHDALRAHLREVVASERLSGVHINFHREDERTTDPAFVERTDWQYHWPNRAYRTFADFLGALVHKKRKNIRQERDRLAAEGWTFRRVAGSVASDADITLMFRCYLRTFTDKGNTPALTEDAFRRLCAAPGLGVTLVQGLKDGAPRASALLMQGGGRLYGRYWGTLLEAPALHFETCYHQGIEHAIEADLGVFEPGAQGEHKIARGFLPVPTWSTHFLAHEGLFAAVRRHVARETEGQRQLGIALAAMDPYRAAESPPDPGR